MKPLRRAFLRLQSAAQGLGQYRHAATRLAVVATGILIAKAPLLALGGGRLASTTAIANAATEISGPFAYGASLLMVAGSAIAWYRHHHDMGAIGNGVLGALFVSGVALGAPTVLSFIPGAAGALI